LLSQYKNLYSQYAIFFIVIVKKINIYNNIMQTEKEDIKKFIELLQKRNNAIIEKEKEKSINQEYNKFMQNRKIKVY